MSSLEFYQNIPSFINPVAFSVGKLSVYWYSIMWIVGFLTVYALLRFRLYKKEADYDIEFIQNVIINALIGAFVGGRIGYILFYDLHYYINHPIEIISPYNFDLGVWSGIYGMSYHGGVVGVILAVVLTARKNNQSVLKLFDFIVSAVPLGYMFGRLGNFFNSELVGRVTTAPIGMYFNDERVLRHPSQLYEAFFEGLLLFIFLWLMRNKKFKPGVLSSLYIMGYAIARFFVEFFREPDEQLGLIFVGLSMGQILSIIMFCVGILIFFWLQKMTKIKTVL